MKNKRNIGQTILSEIISGRIVLNIFFMFFAFYSFAFSQWTQQQFIIGTYHDPHDEGNAGDILRFQQAKRAYFNLLSGIPAPDHTPWEFTITTEHVKRVLSIVANESVQAANPDIQLNILIADFSCCAYRTSSGYPFNEVDANQTKKNYIDSLDPNYRKFLYGYNIQDEPPLNEYYTTNIKKWIDFIKEKDSDKLGLVGLLPRYGFVSDQDYEDYLNAYLTGSGVPNIVFYDSYPFFKDSTWREYFYNLGIIREKAGSKPFWATIQSVGMGNWIDPQPEHLRFMAFCPIAYGAKGLFYYTYETSSRASGFFRDAIIDTNGTTPMPIYNTVLTINKYITKVIGPVVMNSINLGAFHKSDAPTGENTTDHSVDHRIDGNTPVVANVSDLNMLVGIFRHKADISKYYIFAVNKSLNAQSQPSTIKLRGDYRNYVSFAPNVINYNGDTTFTPATSIQCTYSSTDSLTTVTLPKLLEGGEGFLIKVVGLQVPARINDIKVYGNRVYIAHDRNVTMINKETGKIKTVTDGGAYTPAVRIEVDGTKVYICQDSGTHGNLVFYDLDLNGEGLVYNDGGTNTRVTSVAFSSDRIFVGQIINNSGRIVVLNKSNYSYITTWPIGRPVYDVKYQGDAYKSIVVAQQTGILRISTVDAGTVHAGDSLAAFSNGGANMPVKDIAIRSDAVFGALDTGWNGLLVKLDPLTLGWISYWNENDVNPRVSRISLNSDKSKITAVVIRANGQGAFKTFNTSDLSLIDSCFVSDPRCSSYDGNVIYLASGSRLYQTASNGLPSFIFPTAPNLISPANGATMSALEIIFKWNRAIGASTYQIQLSQNSSFSPVLFSDSALVDTTIDKEDSFGSNKIYWWRVIAINSSGAGPWSGSRWFRTSRVPPGCPYVFEWNGKSFECDNNILPQSEYEAESVQDVVDYYRLNKAPEISDGYYNLEIKEFENEFSYFDKFKLLGIPHSKDCQIAVLPDGRIVQYSTPFKLMEAKNPKPVLEKLSTFDQSIMSVNAGDSLMLHFENTTVCLNSAGSEKKGGIVIAGCVNQSAIANPLLKAQAYPKVKIVGWISPVSANSNELESFTLREKPSTVYVPLTNLQNDIKIKFSSTTSLDYVTQATEVPLTQSVEELQLASAVHSVKGDIHSLVENADSLYATLNPSESIQLRYKSLLCKEGEVVDLILFTQGRYIHLNANSSGGSEIPKSFSIYPNYPNPFNPETEVKFDLPEPARVKIIIYDILGREITNLFDGMKPAGYHSVRWNSENQGGSKMSSGIYFCRINLRGESGQQYNKVLKMLLTK
jgi:hypothetical protein